MIRPALVEMEIICGASDARPENDDVREPDICRNSVMVPTVIMPCHRR